MSISHPDWPWFVAEYVISELHSGVPHSFSIHSYLIKANSAEKAYQEALNLNDSLGDAIRDSEGNIIEYVCLGLHNLDTLQVETMEHAVHLSVIHWPPITSPEIKQKHELSLFR